MPTSPMGIATFVLWVVIAFIAILLLGDYLGHKVGRRRLGQTLGFIALGAVVAFAIAAAVIQLR